MKIIIEMTNIESRRIYKNEWIDLDNITIDAFIELLILINVNKSYGESLDKIFEANNRSEYRATFSKYQFKMILRVMRFDSRTDREERRERDKLAAIRYKYRLLLIYSYFFFTKLCIFILGLFIANGTIG